MKYLSWGFWINSGRFFPGKHNKNALLDYNTCVCPVFLFLVLIPGFYAKSWSLYAKVSVLLSKWHFLRQNICPKTYSWAQSRLSVAGGGGRWHVAKVQGGCCKCEAHCAKLGGGEIRMGEFAWMCTELFWRKKFIAPSPIPNPTPSLAPESIRDLEPKLRGASGIMTSWLQWRYRN